MRKITVIVAAGLFCLVAIASVPTLSRAQKDKIHRNAKKIQNHYIVVLDDSVIGEKGDYSIAGYMADDMASIYRGKLNGVYKHALNGFSIEMSDDDAQKMADDYRVKFVEEDGVMSIDVTQTGATWGI